MSKDMSELVGAALGRAAREAIHNASITMDRRSRGQFSGARGLVTGAGLVVAAPLVRKGIGRLANAVDLSDGAAPLKDGVSAGARGVRNAGGKLTDLPEAVPGAIGGHRHGNGSGIPGVGKGRRLPVQIDIDIGAPIRTVYNEWTQFEDWPNFMHRLQSAVQIDNTHVRFKTRIWGISKEFTAEIVEQRPDERIQWRVTEGVTHTGVVTFHELAPRLTRVEVSLDIEPGSLIEKAGRGLRHIKRAVRSDLARFKAYVLMQEDASGEWRGEVHEGHVRRRSGASASTSSGRGSSRGSSSSKSTARSSKSAGRSPASSSGGSGKTTSPSSSKSESAGSSGRSSAKSGSGSRSSRSRSSGSGSSSGRSRAKASSARSKS
jgi:uncharacterized membrane protein